MSLSTLTTQDVAALQNTSPASFLEATGAQGRTLREGRSDLDEIQRRNIDKSQKTVLREVARFSGEAEEDVRKIWQEDARYGQLHVARLQEAVSESAMPQLLRFGVQNFLFDGYAAVPTIYPDLVRVVASSGAEELYAPLYGVELPQTVQPGQEFGDSRLLGLDVHVPNTKKGRILSIERELISDDRTGQIVTRAGQLGERMRYAEETDVIAALTNTNGPTGVAQYTTTIGNVGGSGSGVALTGSALQSADIALQEMLDPLGNKMLVMPDTLLVSPADKFNAAVLLQSSLQPSVPQGSGSNFTYGATGWTMSTNPLQGLYALKVSRFMPTTGLTTGGSWFLMEAKKSLVFQDREALEVLQEGVDSGGSFDREIYRYRARRRYAAALIESRYVYRGN